MKYCNNCILPNTRPNIVLMPDGKCSACHNHKNKFKINWTKKKKDFNKIIKNIKKKKTFL